MRRQYDGQPDASHAMWPVSGAVMNDDRSLYSSCYYRFQRELLRALARRMGFDCFVVTLRVLSLRTLPEAQRVTFIRSVSEVMKNQLRKTDQIFDRFEEEEGVAVLLPGTGEAGARKVIERLERAFAACSDALLAPAACNFIMQPLFVKVS